MNRSIRSQREIVAIYRSLIRTASNNIGEKVKTDWGTWVPTMRGVATMTRRMEKLMKGA
tara:strand:- start:2983 stop:3159 length:177 start_codon:yes stop_codon:yes gene_type:complete